MNKAQKRELAVAILLVGCVVVVAGWELATKLAAQPFETLRMEAEDFADFAPQSKRWSVRVVHVKASPTEPTVIAYLLRGRKAEMGKSKVEIGSAAVLVRIVHGYNMVDCMRIKHYNVDLLADTRSSPPTSNFPPQEDNFQLPALPCQVWGLTSSVEDRAVWVTTMLRAADFSATKVDTRDMAFPRIGTPDDPSWAPTGLKWSSFRHPIRNARQALRAKWNASRCDIWTFLRLRQPAWASNEMLTLVTEYRGPSVLPEQEPDVTQYVLEAHQFMLREFQTFWRKRED
jgi:hypothetical protein